MKKDSLVSVVTRLAGAVYGTGVETRKKFDFESMNAPALERELEELSVLVMEQAVKNDELKTELIAAKVKVVDQAAHIASLLDVNKQLTEQVAARDEEIKELQTEEGQRKITASRNDKQANIKVLEERLGIKAESSLWGEVVINRQGDRFVLSFYPNFYRNNREDCYHFLGRLQNRAQWKTFKADFDADKLVIIAKSGTYRRPSP